MSPSDREALAARKRALREQLERRRAAAAEDLARRRAAVTGARPEPKRDRRWLWLLLAILAILLLLLQDCTCAPEPIEVVGPAEVPAPEPEPAAEPPPPRPRQPKLKIARMDRPEYTSEVPEVLPWVASFRLQVEARSPRLAACFVGAQRPGRLKWTAAVEPGTGRVSDETLEPTVAEEVLTREQRRCVSGVLSEPPYNLEGDDERATPTRVGMVIEF